MVMRATREARAMAVERGEQFGRLLRNDAKALRALLVQAKVQPFTENIVSGSALFDNPAMYARAKDWWDRIPYETKNEIIYFMNTLEAWAMCFTHALAEGDVVFAPCGPTFCSIVMQYGAWVIIARRDQSSGFYSNVVKLFNAWRAQLDAMDGDARQEAALRATNAAEERMAQHKLPTPLGKDLEA